jgi:uncharacterized protein (TIGR03435 family)
MHKSFLTIGFFLIPACLFSQPRLTFEVASVREAGVGGGVRGGCHGIDSTYSPGQQADAPPLGQCLISDARLSHLIGIAYGVTMGNLKTGPDWIQRGDLRFHVQAKADDTKATEAQLLTMLQNLLVERFQLKFHMETVQTSGFTLTVAKNGPKLKPTQAVETSLAFTGPKGQLTKPVPGQLISMTARKVSIAALANLLSQISPNPVLDKTGLDGQYDFALTWDEEAGPALSTAVREQLGLSLNGTKVPVSTLVVDAAEKPSAN